jgi:hypothetical protein
VSETKLVIIETDPETGMAVIEDRYRVACAVNPEQLERWAQAKNAWDAAQEEMAVIFKAHGGRHYGDPWTEESEPDREVEHE